MKVIRSYLGVKEKLDLNTPEEVWDTLTNISKYIKERLTLKGITEFSLGKIYVRIDIRTKYHYPEDGVKIISSDIDSINVIYKTTEESETKSVRFRLGTNQTMMDLTEVYGKAMDKVDELKKQLSLLTYTE